MATLPTELKQHQYKKWKGKIFINTSNGHVVQLIKIVNRSRGWIKGLNFYFKQLNINNSHYEYYQYHRLTWLRHQSTLINLREISLEEVENIKHDVKILFD